MYHSYWFQLLLGLLTINVVVCSINRISATTKIVFVKKPSFNLAKFRGRNDNENFIAKHTPEQLKELYEPIISRGFRYTKTEQTDEGFCIFAEKGRWTRLGIYGVHFSVILLFLGSLIGSLYGFDGYVNIEEGDSVKNIKIQNTGKTRPLNFEILCEDFDVSFYDSGTPKEFRSSLTILEQGKPVLKKDIIVNDPLRYKGINIFQSSYGALPPHEISLNFTSTETGKVYEKKLLIGQQIDLPEAGGKFVINNSTNSYNFMGRNLGETFIGILTPDDGKPSEIILPVRFKKFDRMRRGDMIISISGYAQRYYTGLQVTKDPGVWVVYAGFLLMIIGCFITFFISHQRLCIDIGKKGKKSKVMVAGTANKNKLSMQKKIQQIAKKLADLGDSA